jgi:hypothetical protein
MTQSRIIAWSISALIYEAHQSFDIIKGVRADLIADDGTGGARVDRAMVLAVSTTLPRSWPAEGGQNFVTIANHHTASTGIRKIDHHVSTDASRGRKNETLDTLRNPDPGQLLRRRIPAATNTESDDIRQFRWKRGRKIKISVRGHGQDVCHTGIFPDIDLISTPQSILAGRDFTHSRFFFETRIDCPYACRHKATPVQSGPFAADYVVGVKIPERHGPEEIALERGRACDQLR